jgi:7-keto-8-aminopelargonate synthetase-like enzyme
VVSDTVFSMDGDVAPIDELAAVCARTGALLVLDDAHAVFGAPPVPPGVAHLRVGTLSKMFGSLGGYVTGPRRYVDLLINRARPFIFTTAPTPPDMAAALAALTLYRGDEGASRRGELRSRIDQMRPGHPSPILPVVLGGEELAVRAAAVLLERGLLVPAVRPPTVPQGSSRLRIALSAAHTAEQVSSLVEALDALVMSPL